MKAKTFSFKFIAFLKDENEVEVMVTVEYTPGHSGHRDKYGCPMEPDEPPSYEIISCTDLNGTEYDPEEDLQAGEYQRIIEAAFEEHEDVCFED